MSSIFDFAISNGAWLFSGVGLSAITLIYSIIINSNFDKQNQDSKNLAEKIAKIAVETDAESKTDAIKPDLIENLVNTYHRQALSQASIQFYFSVIAATSGFALIIFMVLTKNGSSDVEIILKSLPGAAISSVSGLFFKQASETRQRATELYDRLRNDKQVKEAISLVNTIDDISVKSIIKAQIALNMSGIKCDSINTSELFNKMLNK